MAVSGELLLYADNTCLLSMGKDTKEIEDQLNIDFSSRCEWFVDNKLTIHFGEEKLNLFFLAPLYIDYFIYHMPQPFLHKICIIYQPCIRTAPIKF